MCNQKELWKDIEYLQEKMRKTIRSKGVNSPEAKRAILMFRNKVKEYNNLVNY
jgi:hypothetical protein